MTVFHNYSRERMDKRISFFLGLLILLMPLSCSVAGEQWELNPSSGEEVTGESGLAIGTIRSRDGIRFIQLDDRTAGYILNPQEVSSIPDGTRVFVRYTPAMSAHCPSFCSDAVLIEWASAVEVGTISFAMDAPQGDPVSILTDWTVF